MDKQNRDWGRVLHRIGFWGVMLLILSSLALLAPSWFGMQMFSISSGSMEPELPTGSIVYTEAVEPAALQTGDVIVFASGVDSGFVTHRVVRNDVDSEKVTTKGDANDVEDPMPVNYGNIFGRVKWHLPLLGFLKSRAGKAVYMTLYLVFLGIMALGKKGMPENRQITKEDVSKAEGI